MFGRFWFASLPALFSVTLFLSAGLLFLVELIIAKLILPLFGGTPAVWNTCMMFFQALLLAGYGYAHLSGSRIRLNRQFALHLALLVVAGLTLPIAVPRLWASSLEGSPIGAILLLLTVSVGLPFLVLSSTAPLLQRWFALTGHPSAVDPYFLYSASNLGSMVALIGYPTLIEPHLRLAAQSRFWTAGYLIVLALTLLCAALAWRHRSLCAPAEEANQAAPAETCPPPAPSPTFSQRGRWVLLAFVPSSLMLGVTTFLSTDIAAIPLFWIIPLSLYLLSFIIVFARIPGWVHKTMVLLMPLSIAASLLVTYADLGIPKWSVFLFHLVNFFLYCMVCHGEIARTRPAAERLTEYYLWLSVGGVLGGIFNSLIAPVAFSTVLEYPLILILGAALIPAALRAKRRLTGWKNLLLYLGVPAALAAATHFSPTSSRYWSDLHLSWLQERLPFSSYTFDEIIAYGFPLVLCLALLFLKRPYLFGIGIAALLLTIVIQKDMERDIVHRERSFFGVLTVTRDFDGAFINLLHGTTMHGKQWINGDRRQDPVSYYHQDGPIGHIFSAFEGRRLKKRIAVTGLGTGSIAAYAGKDQEIDYYEIDSAVKRIASDPAYFTFLSECKARWRVIIGDARLTMEKAPPGHYDLIILDAFSSDSIPVHLITREAIRLNLSKLSEGGALLVHITNRYVNLEPVLAALAEEEGLAARICDDDERDYENGKDHSTWVLLARQEQDLGPLARSDKWLELEKSEKIGVWTDDFSNLLSVFKW